MRPSRKKAIKVGSGSLAEACFGFVVCIISCARGIGKLNSQSHQVREPVLIRACHIPAVGSNLVIILHDLLLSTSD